ncbi:MAG TPA: hypothetical protein VKU01_11580 [Bryobacteraceae bacterium]|nr:hypothetical protein [Bryobacteraceae bacterium]
MAIPLQNDSTRGRMRVRINIQPIVLSAAFLFVCPAFWAAEIAKAPLPSDEVAAVKITGTETQRLANLREYSVVRTYTLRNSHLGNDVTMTARLSYRREEGKTFEVLTVDGASGVAKKVLERLLQSEAEESHKDTGDEFEITTSNYGFHVVGADVLNGRPCYVVEVTPKRKSKYLLQGKVWADAKEFAVVKIEGHPAASLSMWVGKPHVVQEFQKVGPFWMPSYNRSDSKNFMLGASELTIDYNGYQVGPHVLTAELQNGKAPSSQED